jgi:dihydrofolate reductase
MITFCAIAAVAANNVIGNDNCLPWHLPSDLEFFRMATMNRPVIIGRNTFQSMGRRPLPGRHLIVVSSAITPGEIARDEPISIVQTLDDAMNLGRTLASDMGSSHVMIAGGQAIYEAMMPFCETMLITHVDADVPGDRAFPHIDRRQFTGIEIGMVRRDARHAHSFRIVHYVKR